MEMSNRKGVLLTLVTIVLLVIMTAELITYVYLAINYESVSSAVALSSSGYRFAGGLNPGTTSFLHQSLIAALNTLASYESLQSRSFSEPINNSVYAIQSLMTNGTIYGVTLNGVMLNSDLINYTNSIETEAELQSLNLTLYNTSLQIYQTGPYALNATYTALAVINSSSGSFDYPISATSGISLNNTPDLYSVQDNVNQNIVPAQTYPIPAHLVANTHAVQGSTSPFQFIYGTAIVENNPVTCANVPSEFMNSNYILAIPYDTVGTCGMGGLITYSPITGAYNVPYLVYNSISNAISYINNGTVLLLDGPALSLLNLSQLQTTLVSGEYFKSEFAPSYLDWAQGSLNKRSQYGIFSMNLYGQMVPQFSSASQTYILQTTGWPWMDNTLQPFSISLWIDPATTNGIIVDEKTSGATWHQSIIELVNGMLYMRTSSASCVSLGQIPAGSWSSIAITYNGMSFTGYVNGVLMSTAASARSVPPGSNPLYYPLGDSDSKNCGSGAFYSGSMANYQFYNISLTPLQISNLYHGGIDSLASYNSINLDGWWPLDGNLNDYSGKSDNAISFNFPGYTSIYGYTGDPIDMGAIYSGNLTNELEGLSGCTNVNSCSSTLTQHIYLEHSSISSAPGSSVSLLGSFGMANATLPNVMSFTGNSYVEQSKGFNWIDSGQQPFAMSVWIYPTSGNGVIIDEKSSQGNDSVLDLVGGSVYANLNGQTVPSCLDIGKVPLYNWTQVMISFNANGGTVNGYINGNAVASGSSITRQEPAGTPLGYALGAADSSANCGSGAYYNGYMSDFQIYNRILNSFQALELYQNASAYFINTNTVITPAARWTLALGYNGLVNQTINVANITNPGLLTSGSAVACSNGNVIDRICGVYPLQP